MKLNKLVIDENKLDLNFKFYLFLKELNGTRGISEKEIDKLLETHLYYTGNIKAFLITFRNTIETFTSLQKKETLFTLMSHITEEVDLITFMFVLKLLQIKPLLLAQAKLMASTRHFDKKGLHPLSLAYDSFGKHNSYYVRVSGALVSLLFFTLIEEESETVLCDVSKDYLRSIFEEFKCLKQYGLEPNEIFMLMFSESMSQSIKSLAGSSYEDIIYNVLINLAIPEGSIKRTHDEIDKSTEYDFFFNLKGYSYGISAKRTLRERYKQFIKTSYTSTIDVMIEITLGIDLTREKATIIREYGVFLFVADEIYQMYSYLQDIEGIFPVSSLTLKKLKELSKNK